MDVLVAVIACTATLFYASLFEWAVHRFLYHPPKTWPAMSVPHGQHHFDRYPATSYFEWTRRYRAVQPFWLETAYVLLHVPIALLIASWSNIVAVSLIAMLVVYAVLSHYVHPLVHLRTGLFYERTRFFKYLLRRHIQHHRDVSVNLNIVLPFGDWLFGTSHNSRRRRAS